MNTRPKIIFHLAGHDFHPIYDQASAIVEWLGPDYWCHPAESLAAFEHLGECDLLIFLGMYFTGWEGRYRAPGELHRRALERYVASGRPIITCHGAVISYDDWPRFGQLTGFWWPAGVRSFAPPREYAVRIELKAHPAAAELHDYTVFDAPPYDVQTAADMRLTTLASTDWDGTARPILMVGEGGRVRGAGRSAFIAHGHDMHSFESEMVRRMWINTVGWCLSGA